MTFKKYLFAGTVACAAAAFAETQYKWTDALGTHDFMSAGNWATNNVAPDTFPPPLDTATSGGTHPSLCFVNDSTVTMTDGTTATVNWIRAQGVDKDMTFDLGANSVVNLFGGQDAAFWLGDNFPNGQRVTLKSGTIKGMNSSRNTSLRFGAGVYRTTEDNNLPSFFRIDGSTACVRDLYINLGGRFSELCITNGASFYHRNANMMLAQNINGLLRIAGKGSALYGAPNTLYMGDNASTYDVPSCTMHITDYGMLTNVAGNVGNRGSNFRVLIDNHGVWAPHAAVTLSAANDQGTPTNNVMEVVDGGVFAFPPSVSASSAIVAVGSKGSHNRLTVSNATFKASILRVGWYAAALNNLVDICDSVFTCPTIGIGGTASDSATGGSCNTIRFTDCDLGTSANRTTQFEFANCINATGCASNKIEFVRSTWYNPSTYFGVGGWGGSNPCLNNHYNEVIFRDHSTADLLKGPDGFLIGRAGHGNRLVIDDHSTVTAKGQNDVAPAGYGVCVGFATVLQNSLSNELYVANGSSLSHVNYISVYAPYNRMVIDDASVTAQFLRLYYYWSTVQGKVIDSPSVATEEKAIFDTHVVFKGAAPSLVVPEDASQEKRGDLDFYGLVILGFELPATPYAAAPLRSDVRIRFNDDCRYEFDFSKVTKTAAWAEYPLAEATGSGTLVISDAELARLSGLVADAAKPFGLRAKVIKSADGKKLILKSREIGGTLLIVR